MTPTIIQPASESEWLQLRTQDITSTESAALFGMSPYITEFELYHRKRSGEVPDFSTNERMRWGNRLESAIAHGIAEEQGWEIRPMKEYMRDEARRIGSSFDFVIMNLGEPAHLEIKNVDYLAFRDGWIEHEDGSIEAPEHIEMQVQHQMAVSGFKKAFIGAFIGGNRGVVIERQRDEKVIAAIRYRIGEFWQAVESGTEPKPDFPADADMVIRLNQYAQPGKIFDASGDEKITSLIEAYKAACVIRDTADEDAQTYKAQLLEAIGDAEKVLCNQFTISAGIVAETPPTVITPEMVGKSFGGRKGYRSMRVNVRKSTQGASK